MEHRSRFAPRRAHECISSVLGLEALFPFMRVGISFFVRVSGPDGYGWWWSDANEVQLGEDEETVWRTAEEEEEEEKGIS